MKKKTHASQDRLGRLASLVIESLRGQSDAEILDAFNTVCNERATHANGDAFFRLETGEEIRLHEVLERIFDVFSDPSKWQPIKEINDVLRCQGRYADLAGGSMHDEREQAITGIVDRCLSSTEYSFESREQQDALRYRALIGLPNELMLRVYSTRPDLRESFIDELIAKQESLSEGSPNLPRPRG